MQLGSVVCETWKGNVFLYHGDVLLLAFVIR